MTDKIVEDTPQQPPARPRAQGALARGGPLGPRPGAAAAQPTGLFPPVSTILQAGTFGAALGGITAGVMELTRVKRGEITSEEAVGNVAKSTAQSAATMAVASIAGHMVRAHPLIGIAALAAAGVGAVMMLSNAGQAPEATVEPTDLPEDLGPGVSQAGGLGGSATTTPKTAPHAARPGPAGKPA